MSKNVVDKDIQSMFSPLNNMLMMFSPRYRFKNNVILPNGQNNFCCMLSALLASQKLYTSDEVCKRMPKVYYQYSTRSRYLCPYPEDDTYWYTQLNFIRIYHLILYYIIEVFIHSLVYIQLAIFVLQKDFYNDIKAPNLLTLLHVVVYNFPMYTFSEHERRLYKNVLRLHRASFKKIRVCGLFYVDAALQLSLTSLLTSYTIVLLQFAIL
ncbi:hypothetical protein HF086_002161 [Spodoptera exigua]|uniref:Uncharacterized protein n=1 Tax=Spodoptera exigua TaxID=7107 RepID=A0A922MGQ9_SPOEX|nr:hypothetical protein HF086_002161 [Spodoptera exigua]